MGKYDKTIKENLQPLLKSLASRIGLNIERGKIEIVKDKLQYTIEREPDFLFKVCHEDPSEDYIAQFDFQSLNDLTMPDRMLFYRNMIKLVLKLPVRQVVFYLGNDPLEMSDTLIEPDLYFKYPLYDIRIFSSNSFLQSNVPQEVLLAILGNFEGETPDKMMEKILNRLQELVKRKKDFQKFAFHLHVLSGLRKLQGIFQQKIKVMPLIYDIDIENDPIYLDGIQKGEKRGLEKGLEKGELKKATLTIEKMLIDGHLSIKRISDFVEETEAFVINIQQRLIQEGRILSNPQNGKSTRKKNDL
jgi:predicted transposase YdaD